MAVYIVGYDLRRPGQDYDKLFAAIKAYGTYWHCLDSTWIIRTSLTAQQVRNDLMRYIDQNDKMLVAELTGQAAWTGFTANDAQWMQNVLNNR